MIEYLVRAADRTLVSKGQQGQLLGLGWEHLLVGLPGGEHGCARLDLSAYTQGRTEHMLGGRHFPHRKFGTGNVQIQQVILRVNAPVPENRAFLILDILEQAVDQRAALDGGLVGIRLHP